MGTEKQLIKLNILDGHLIHHVNFSNLSFSRYISHLAIEKSLRWPTYSIMSMANIFSFNLTQGLFGLTYSNKCWPYFKRNSLIILKTKFKIYKSLELASFLNDFLPYGVPVPNSFPPSIISAPRYSKLDFLSLCTPILSTGMFSNINVSRRAASFEKKENI